MALVMEGTAYGLLDDRSQKILDWVVQCQNPKRPMFVQDIVTGCGIASPATVHKCLATLDRAGLLAFTVDPEDSRRRIVTPTDKSRKIYKDLSVRVDRWTRDYTRVSAKT